METQREITGTDGWGSDIFVVGTGGVYTATWEPDFPDGWHGWWRLG